MGAALGELKTYGVSAKSAAKVLKTDATTLSKWRSGTREIPDQAFRDLNDLLEAERARAKKLAIDDEEDEGAPAGSMHDPAEFEYFGPRVRVTDRGLARFTETPQKIAAFITSLGRMGIDPDDVLGTATPRKRKAGNPVGA